MQIDVKSGSSNLLIYLALGAIMYLFFSPNAYFMSPWTLIWLVAWPVLMILKVVKGGVLLVGVGCAVVGTFLAVKGRFLLAGVLFSAAVVAWVIA